MKITCAIFAALWATTMSAPTSAQQINIIPDSLVLTSTIERTPAVAFVFGAQNNGGKVAVCGAYFYPEGSIRISPFQKQQLREAYYFKMKGKRLGISTAHFNRIENMSAGRKTKVTCKTSRVAWKKGYSTKQLDVRSNRSQIYD